MQIPTVAYTPGAQVTVTWALTIPHPADNLDSGVRIAMHYGPGDSFDQNILMGGVIGSGAPGTVSAELTTVTVTLPAKTCDYCTLQWLWAANADGGSYIGCSDVAITANGALPNYVGLPSQVGLGSSANDHDWRADLATVSPTLLAPSLLTSRLLAPCLVSS